MRIKDIFWPKAGQKVSEKYLRQALAVSICSILLCMSCLVGTTWAWYVVSIDNSNNAIHIAQEPPAVQVTIDDNIVALNPLNLTEGTYDLQVVHNGETDDVQRKSTLYVTFSVDEIQGYVILDHTNGYRTSVNITVAKDSAVSWSVSWLPDGAKLLENNKIDLSNVQGTDTVDDAEDPTKEPSDNTEGEDEVDNEESETPEVPGENDPPVGEAVQTPGGEDPVVPEDTEQPLEQEADITEENTEDPETEENSAE